MANTSVSFPADLDGLHIDASEDWEVAYWTRKLGVTPQALRRAVEAAGSRLASAVGMLLAEQQAVRLAGEGESKPT